LKYLLDTHVFLWACIQPEKLSSKAFEIISDNQSILYLSSASIWEIAIKAGLGKLKFLSKNLNLKTFIEESIKHLNLIKLPVENHHIYTLYELPEIHKDPFDRIHIAQANSEGLILITNDKQIRKYNVKTLW